MPNFDSFLFLHVLMTFFRILHNNKYEISVIDERNISEYVSENLGHNIPHIYSQYSKKQGEACINAHNHA